MTKVVVTLRAGIKEARVPCRLPAVEKKFHQGVPVTQSPGREPPSSTVFRHQHRSDPECSISYPVHVSRSLAHRSERAVLREDSRFAADHFALPRTTQDLVDTFDPHAQWPLDLCRSIGIYASTDILSICSVTPTLRDCRRPLDSASGRWHSLSEMCWNFLLPCQTAICTQLPNLGS